MLERFAARADGVDVDGEVLFDLLLADKVVEAARPQAVKRPFFFEDA